MKKIIGKACGNLFLIFLLVISLYPFLWCLISSFKTKKEILSSAFSLPSSLSLKNYIGAFEMAPLAKYFMNSVLIAIPTVIIGMILISMGAYVMARGEFRSKGMISSLIATSMLIPSTAIILPIFLLMNKTGLYDTKMGLGLVYLCISMPTVLFVLRSYFLTIPREMEEAAQIDGAGFYRTFFGLVMPLARPGLATAAVLIFLNCWNDFLYALMLTSGDKARTVPVALSQLNSAMGGDYGQIFAACTVIVLPSILFYVCFQKKIEEAMIAGAVKG